MSETYVLRSYLDECNTLLCESYSIGLRWISGDTPDGELLRENRVIEDRVDYGASLVAGYTKDDKKFL